MSNETTLHDALNQAFDQHIELEVKTEPVKEVQVEETAAQKEQRTRDEQGRFAKEQPEVIPETPQVSRKRPSSWKKELWNDYDKLPQNVADYILQREDEAAKGVSTYKAEWDRAKPILEALTPFQPLLQQHNIAPERFIADLGNAQKILAIGTPQEKVALMASLARDYRIPLQEVHQMMQQLPQQLPQQAQQPVNVEAVIEQKLLEREANHAVAGFGEMKDAQGQLTHPHYEAVRDTMAGLLQSGLADDLQTAYDYALALPKHADIQQAISQQRAKEEDAKRLAEQQKTVARAKSQTVSTKSSTPSGQVTQGKKGLRSQLEEAFDTHEGRV